MTHPDTMYQLQAGDWVTDGLAPHGWCYEVRSVEGDYVLLRAFNITTKRRFNCSGVKKNLLLIRKKDGTRITPPWRCE